MLHSAGAIALLVWSAVTVAVVLVVVYGPAPRRGQAAPRRDEVTDDATGQRRAAIIVNPTKFEDLDSVHEEVRRVCRSEGWADPMWIETTEDDPGTGQAHQARDRGATVVCPLGGDGTVRAVASALIDTDTPMGLLPGGTGNLLARNLDVPIDSLADAMRVALNGTDRRIDVGGINVAVPSDTQSAPKDYIFLVMAGVGFDAAVMADAPEKLKAYVGWPAYLVSGAKHLAGARFDIDITLDDHPRTRRSVRTVVVGNVGRLQGGIKLLPNAVADDGTLDLVALSPIGVAGWASVAASLLSGHRRGHSRVEHARCRTAVLDLQSTQEVQLDGDAIGPGSLLTITARPSCLTVRT